MLDCSCNTFPASLGNVTFGASVGIQTTSPAAELDVVGAVLLGPTDDAYGTLTFRGGTPGTQWQLSKRTSTDGAPDSFELNYWDGSAWNGPFLTVLTDGQVGISTNAPGATCDVAGRVALGPYDDAYGTLTFRGGTPGTQWELSKRTSTDGAPDGFELNYWNGSGWVGPVLTALPSGTLGVGTSAPAYPLDVSGAARITGGLELGALLTCPGMSIAGSGSNVLQVGYDPTGMQAQIQATQTGSGPQTLALNPAGGPVGLSPASAPSQPQLALQSGGGLTPDQASFYVVTAVDATGAESPLSAEASATTTDTELSILVSWPAVGWASAYNLYRGTTSGGENSVVSVPAQPTTGTPPLIVFLDTSATWPAGTLPTFAAFLATALPSTGAVLVNGVLGVGALPPPSGISAAPSSGTGGLALGTYSYVLTSLDGAGGESLPSQPVSVTVTDADTSYVQLSWAQLEAVGSYNVYRTPSGGTTQQLTVSGPSFLDQGQTGTTVNPPSVSTAYAARLDATGLYIGGKKIADANGSYYG